MRGKYRKKRIAVKVVNAPPVSTGGCGNSDVRVKRDIVQIGRLDSGIGLYRYRYIWSDEVYVGVMAQEVAKVVPTAVRRGTDGYLRVDYDQLGQRLQTWDEWVAAQAEAVPVLNT